MFGMDLSQIPLFAVLRGRLGYLSQRQQVIAQNVANSDTPGYLPKDMKPFTVEAHLPTRKAQAMSAAAGPAATHPGHIHLQAQSGGYSGFNAKPITQRDSETSLDGNAVVLEEQMMKLTDARMNYDAAIGFYQKSLGLLRLASRAPGR